MVTLIVDEIWFFVALSSTLLGSELHGHTAVLLLELIKRQPVTSPADYSVANILSYISMSKSKFMSLANVLSYISLSSVEVCGDVGIEVCKRKVRLTEEDVMSYEN